MSNYRKFINKKTDSQIEIVTDLVSQPIPGREEEMVPASGGAGFAFESSQVNQYKRWLVFGSLGSTLYASSKELTLKNLEVVENMLATNYKLALDIIQDFSVRNVVKGQKTLLTVLSLALAYDDKTVRVYNSDHSDVNKLVDKNGLIYKFSDSVHRVSISNDRSTLYAMIFDKNTNGNYRYESVLLIPNGIITKLKDKPENLKWHENAYKPAIKGNNGLIAINYSLLVKRYASEIAPSMVRQSSMLFESIANIHAQRGWGAMVHKMVENFYNNMDNNELAQQFIKYGTRQQWSHKNLLRKVKPATMYHKQRAVGLSGQPLVMSQVLRKEDLYIHTPVPNPDEVRSNIFAWSVGKFNALEIVKPSKELNSKGYIADPMTKIWAADALKEAKTAKEVAEIVRDYQMPREAVERANTVWLKEPIVWEALLPHMPGNALVRNLRNMAELGVLKPMSDAETLIINRLTNPKYMGKVHPVQVMQAAVTYDLRVFSNSPADNKKRTRGDGNIKSYDISQPIVNALNVALNNSFKNVQSTSVNGGPDKRIMLSVDISGSMFWEMLDNFFPFFPGEAAAMMAMIFMRIESRIMPMVFSNTLEPMNISNTSSINDVIAELQKHSGASTDIGLPIKYALEKKIPIDAFISVTDNDLNTGYHPAKWMKKYRSEMRLPESKFITIAMQDNNITVADPKDPLMLDVEGCSADTQDTVISYIRGDF